MHWQQAPHRLLGQISLWAIADCFAKKARVAPQWADFAAAKHYMPYCIRDTVSRHVLGNGALCTSSVRLTSAEKSIAIWKSEASQSDP